MELVVLQSKSQSIEIDVVLVIVALVFMFRIKHVVVVCLHLFSLIWFRFVSGATAKTTGNISFLARTKKVIFYRLLRENKTNVTYADDNDVTKS